MRSFVHASATVCIKQLFPSRWSRELPCPRGPEGGAHGTRQPSQTIESSAQRRRSPSNKPHRTITLMFAKATARGSKSSRCTSRILRGHCYDGGALGPLSKQGHRNGWRESTVFRQPYFFARSPSGHSPVLQTRFSPAICLAGLARCPTERRCSCTCWFEPATSRTPEHD